MLLEDGRTETPHFSVMMNCQGGNTNFMMPTQFYEGEAEFNTKQAFYNPRSKLVRDLGVLAAKVYRDSNHSLRVLDGFAGCGVRSLRYWLESKADFLWVNEGNPDLGSVLEANYKV